MWGGGKAETKSLEIRNKIAGTSLVAQWLRIPPANAGDTGSSPGLGRSHMPRSN